MTSYIIPASESDEQPVARTRAELAESLLYLDGKRFSLGNYPMFRAIYDGGYRKMGLMTCRQVAKSTTLSNFSITESIATPFFKTFFIAPTREQTQKYSATRVGKTIQYSPLVQRYFLTANTSNRVLSRTFANGSEIHFSYAAEDADRCRGTSADRLMLDEVQDMLLDAVVPVVKECLANSDYQYEMYCGTPKTMENGLQHIWETSTQTEWAMKCEGCNKYNIVRSEKSFGKLGPVCLKCGKYLNPLKGFWLDTGDPKAEVKCFHISRAIMPRNVPICWTSQDKIDKATMLWQEVMAKLDGRNAYPLSMFRNEVVGVSDSVGRRIVTVEMLREASTGPAIQMKPDVNTNARGVTRIAAGIDWSGGGTQIKSRTVLVILGFVPATGKYRVMYYKIFPGLNPVDEVNEIANVLSMYASAGLVGCDAGEGNMPTDMLRKRLGAHKVVKFQYSGSGSGYIRWSEEGRLYSVNRTRAIDSLMSSLNRREIEFPKDLAAPGPPPVPFQDILNEYEEVTGEGRKVWRHAPTNPDDFLHALNFARLAMQVQLGELDLTS